VDSYIEKRLFQDWQLFRDGCPKGESPAQVVTRADAVVRRKVCSGMIATYPGLRSDYGTTRFTSSRSENEKHMSQGADTVKATQQLHDLGQGLWLTSPVTC
jgi:probable phosphoglycerate mutase